MWILVSCGVASTDRRMPALPVSLCSRRATSVAVRGVRKADHRELSSRSESSGARPVEGDVCNCGSTYVVRPGIGSENWGGITGTSCVAPTQTMTVTIE